MFHSPVCGKYVVIVLEGFIFQVLLSVSLVHAQWAIAFMYSFFYSSCSYTSHQMTFLLAEFVWVCEMELSLLLSERCREMSPSPFSLFTPHSHGWSRSASGEWQLLNLWKLNRSQRRHLMISLATHAEVRVITLRWLQRFLCCSLAGLLKDRFHRHCGSHWCYKLLLCHRSRACFCFS